MITQQLTAILADAPIAELLEWSELVRQAAEVLPLKPSKMGLIMVRAKDSVQKQMFNLGEVLISDCSMLVDKRPGYGAVLGGDAKRAEAIAILDGASYFGSEKWELHKAAFDKWIAAQQRLQEAKERSEFSLVSRSKVDFGLMAEEGEQQ